MDTARLEPASQKVNMALLNGEGTLPRPSYSSFQVACAFTIRPHVLIVLMNTKEDTRDLYVCNCTWWKR
jgi:hypothetical protein